jgi:predicted nucleic acid-binding protein
MTLDAFDSDVLIYAATDHPLKDRIRSLLRDPQTCLGSVLLVPEVLSKPVRTSHSAEVEELTRVLSQLSLLPCDLATAHVASALGAAYGLRAADAVHLATAVNAGADRFITNNRRDFPQTIEEIEIVYPEQL